MANRYCMFNFLLCLVRRTGIAEIDIVPTKNILRGTPMGFYEQRIFPWLNDRLNRDPGLQELPAEAMAPARGKVIETGFGGGAKLPHYPAAVDSPTAGEPKAGMR